MYFKFKNNTRKNGCIIGRKLLKSCKGIDQREHTPNSDEEDMYFRRFWTKINIREVTVNLKLRG